MDPAITQSRRFACHLAEYSLDLCRPILIAKMTMALLLSLEGQLKDGLGQTNDSPAHAQATIAGPGGPTDK